ncbi:unnamed protein product, partial [Adineta steineri]
IYYENGATYDGAGDKVTLCDSVTFIYTNVNKNNIQCVNQVAPYIPTAPPTPTTTQTTTTTTVYPYSSPCTVAPPANAVTYSTSLLYGNTSFSNYNWVCQGITLATYGNGLGTFYLEENSAFYGNGGGSHTIYLKKGSKFVSGGGGGHTIYYENGATYDGAGDK